MEPWRRHSLGSDAALAEETLLTTAEPEAIDLVHAALDRLWGTMDRVAPVAVDPLARLQFVTALVEIATNVVRHAYPVTAVDRPISISLQCYPDRVQAVLTDRGIPFSAERLKPSADVLADLPEGGLGLGIARAALDQLEYQRTTDGENVWTLVKRFNA